MNNNYDLIAKIYDPLSRLVFRKSQLKAQTDQLKYISSGNNLLIAGGGTGWILEEISKIYPSGLQITYLEISAEMIRMARERDTGENQVTYIHAGAADFQAGRKYDVILTGFLFDNFQSAEAMQVFTQFDKMIAPEGYWLYTDFQSDISKQTWWQKILLKTMYVFFNLVSGVKAKKVPDLSSDFQCAGYQIVNSKVYYNGFIQAVSFRKTPKS